MTIFKALGSGAFAWLWSGQGISRLGDAVYRIAIVWWVLEKTGSPTAVAILAISGTLPIPLFLLLGGVEVDRFPRARVMLACDIARGAAVSAVALLAFGNLLQVWHLYLANIVLGSAAAFFRPAYIAVLPEITSKDALNSANSLTVLAGHLAMVFGSVVGAGLVSANMTPLAFALNGISFFIGAVFLYPIVKAVTTNPELPRKAGTGLGENLKGGFHAVLGSPWIWVTILVTSLANIRQEGAITVALPFLVKENLKGDVNALAILYSMISIGSMFAALWFGRRTRIRRRGLTAYGAWILGGLMIAALGLPIGLIGSAVATLVLGAATITFYLVWTNVEQELVPRQLLGRVVSIDDLGGYALLPFASYLAGLVTDAIGAPVFFLVGGVLSVAVTFIGLAEPSIRKLD